jgi:hypothetical protein
MEFAEKMAETRLADLKAVEPKLQAFYDSLDVKQKKAFDTQSKMPPRLGEDIAMR